MPAGRGKANNGAESIEDSAPFDISLLPSRLRVPPSSSEEGFCFLLVVKRLFDSHFFN